MKKVKVIILRGIPASGKTTWAKEFIKTHSNYVRVNRDDIRNMLSPNWSKELEKVVKDIQLDSINDSLSRGYNVIIDDTNTDDEKVDKLKDSIRAWMQFSRDYDVLIKERFFLIDLKFAIDRDSKRENPVGSSDIKKMYYNLKKYYEITNQNCTTND